MTDLLKQRLLSLAKNIDGRSQSERLLIVGVLIAALGMAYLTLFFDPIRAEIDLTRRQIRSVEAQIAEQKSEYDRKFAISQEDPNKFANDRLLVITREQDLLDDEIAGLAGDLVSPNDMTRILTTVLERQSGLEFVRIANIEAEQLREGISNADELLAESGTLTLEDVTEEGVAGQVYEHGLIIQFEGNFFDTLRYLRFLEDLSGNFFWDEITFQQQEWPNALVTLEIHTLSPEEGYLGV